MFHIEHLQYARGLNPVMSSQDDIPELSCCVRVSVEVLIASVPNRISVVKFYYGADERLVDLV